MAPALFIIAKDPELPAILRGQFPNVVFATAERLQAIIKVKPGSLVVVLDAADTAILMGLTRKDVRGVVLVTPQQVPMVFRRPIVAAVERPLAATKVVAAITLAIAELAPPTP